MRDRPRAGGERVDVYLVGSEEPYVPVEPTADPELLAAVTGRETS